MKRILKFGCLGTLGLFILLVVIVAVAPPETPQRATTTSTRTEPNLAVLAPAADGAVVTSLDDDSEPSENAQSAGQSGNALPPEIPAGTGPTYNEVCGLNTRDVTEIQLKAHAESYMGYEFTNWQGYVYDVRLRGGQYEVLLADSRRGLLWSRDMVVRGLPREIAEPLRVEQPVLLSGRIASVDVSLGTLCNPIVIESATLVPGDSGGYPLPVPPSGDLSYADVCGVDQRNITEVQLVAYAANFAGRTFSNWEGYVYDVQERSGQYILQLADGPRGLVWSRDMVVRDIPADLARHLNVEQPVSLSGRINTVDVSFGVICNPIEIDSATVIPK